jgi:hypothetical protein
MLGIEPNVSPQLPHTCLTLTGPAPRPSHLIRGDIVSPAALAQHEFVDDHGRSAVPFQGDDLGVLLRRSGGTSSATGVRVTANVTIGALAVVLLR